MRLMSLLVCLIAAFALAACAEAPSPTAPSALKGETPAALMKGVDKVVVCHIPPGNPDNAHVIVVGAPSVPAHEAHGDTVGECDDEGPGPVS